jgi:hypothetical protein
MMAKKEDTKGKLRPLQSYLTRSHTSCFSSLSLHFFIIMFSTCLRVSLRAEREPPDYSFFLQVNPKTRYCGLPQDLDNLGFNIALILNCQQKTCGLPQVFAYFLVFRVEKDDRSA